jgi:hypothetical protein
MSKAIFPGSPTLLFLVKTGAQKMRRNIEWVAQVSLLRPGCSAQEKHFHERTAKPQISPLRCAPVEMTKGKTVPGNLVARREPFSAPLQERSEP